MRLVSQPWREAHEDTESHFVSTEVLSLGAPLEKAGPFSHSLILISGINHMAFDGKVTWDTIAAGITAIATAALAIGAWVQLPLVAKQVKGLSDELNEARKAEAAAEARTREWETIKICQRYDFDPVIESACKSIWVASVKGTTYTNENVDEHDMKCILNYLDGISVGIKQGLYIETIVKEQMGIIFKGHVDNFILSNAVSRDGYECLLELYGKWFQQTAPSSYRRD